MPNIEVHIDRPGGVQRAGTLHRQARRGGEAVAFEYHPDWLTDPDRFSLELVRSVAELFSLSAADARDIVREVAQVTRRWRDVAAAAGARPAEIRRMERAFEHDDLARALAL